LQQLNLKNNQTTIYTCFGDSKCSNNGVISDQCLGYSLDYEAASAATIVEVCWVHSHRTSFITTRRHKL